MVCLAVRLEAQQQGRTGAGGLGIEGHTQCPGVFLDQWQHCLEVATGKGDGCIPVKIGIQFGQFPPFLLSGTAQVIYARLRQVPPGDQEPIAGQSLVLRPHVDHPRQQPHVMAHTVIIGQHLSADQIGQQSAHVGCDRHRRGGVQCRLFGRESGIPFGPLEGRQAVGFFAVAGAQRDHDAVPSEGLHEGGRNEDADVPNRPTLKAAGGLRHVVSLVEVLGK